VVVHDVEVDNVSAGSDHVVDLLAELGEVGGEDGRSDEEVLVHSGIPRLTAEVSGLGLVNGSLFPRIPRLADPGNVCWKMQTQATCAGRSQKPIAKRAAVQGKEQETRVGKHLTGGKGSIDNHPATHLRRNPRLCL
jgi:hypothetical protein